MAFGDLSNPAQARAAAASRPAAHSRVQQRQNNNKNTFARREKQEEHFDFKKRRNNNRNNYRPEIRRNRSRSPYKRREPPASIRHSRPAQRENRFHANQHQKFKRSEGEGRSRVQRVYEREDRSGRRPVSRDTGSSRAAAAATPIAGRGRRFLNQQAAAHERDLSVGEGFDDDSDGDDDDDDDDDESGLRLDEDFIWVNLLGLNDFAYPRLNQNQLKTALKDVLDNVRHLISEPVSVVEFEYNEIVARVLATLKQRIWHGFGKLPDTWKEPITQESFVIYQSSDTDSTSTDRVDEVPTASWSETNMSTPSLGQFLVAINGFIRVRNEVQFSDYLVVEPPFGQQYLQMIAELNQVYPKGSEDALAKRCEQSLPQAVEGADGASWSAFVRFMTSYLAYLRDVDSDQNKYLETYDLLSELQKHANAALGHGSLGYLMLQTTIKTAKIVCRLAIGLDKRPDLIRHLRGNADGGSGDGDDGQETLPERAANSLRGAFNTCLADRSLAVGGLKDGKPEGKKQGIYIFANLCLKILFQCKKTRNAANLFEQIETSAPPLAAYPKSQRVTYLYYLGRYWFQNNHFFRAQAALEKAYYESPSRPVCAKQRRHILVYLIASNIVLGRFPSQALLSQPEAAGLQDRFLPLCLAIRQGNLDLFKRHMYDNPANVDWMLYWRILLQLRSKCEVLVWRSLIRKTFVLAGRQPDPASKIAPTVDVDAIVAAYTALVQANATGKGPFDNPPDPDFDVEDVRAEDDTLLPDSYTVESILSSLVTQGLLGGYVSHRQLKFAITGAARKGVMAAGFPQPWGVLARKAGGSNADHVPGWKKESPFAEGMNGNGPRVIRMSGAKAAGT